MTPRRLGLLLGLAALAVTVARATDTKDSFERPATLAVALTGGDTPSTYNVTITTTVATSLRAAVTNRSRRKICIQNPTMYTLNIGSSTNIASNFWTLPPIGASASNPLSVYCTNSSGQFYAEFPTGTNAVTISSSVFVLEETQSIP